MKKYIVCGYTPWSKKVFDQKISKYNGNWFLFSKKSDLTLSRIKKIDPVFIFFLHWSWIVPKEIVDNYNCVCFHMTDVPYGRGGSPLQNLIVRGHKTTKLTALKMDQGMDTGPVYLKRQMPLDGKASEIYERAYLLSSEMIKNVIKGIKPKPQTGKSTVFKRRKPEQSEITAEKISDVYDYIRMLDAEGYPLAFVKKDGFLYEFFDATLEKKEVIAKVRIKKI